MTFSALGRNTINIGASIQASPEITILPDNDYEKTLTIRENDKLKIRRQFMETEKLKYKLSFMFTILGITFIIIALIQPIREALDQFNLKRNISLDYLSLFSPYIFSLTGSILIIFSTIIIKEETTKMLIIFLIKNLPMVIFFNILMTREITLNIANLYYMRHLDIYILYLVYTIGQMATIVFGLISLKHYKVSID
ncbi:MAG: hypothetical protein PHT03_05205 [Bacilli bacterium]|nr:hypothetical protein [Bacilli bacterium]